MPVKPINIAMQLFVEKESRNLRRLRNTTFAFLVLIDMLVLSFFIYAFYSVYQERDMHVGFVAYSFKTILSIQFLLMVVLVPLMWIIYRRFQFILLDIKELNEEFAMLFHKYCSRVPRFFAAPPQYLISQKGLLVFKNLRRFVFQPDSIQKILIRRVNLGRFGKKCRVYVYQNSQLVTSFTYDRLYPEEVEFLKQHITVINRLLIVEDES